jgi:hypothetical protein
MPRAPSEALAAFGCSISGQARIWRFTGPVRNNRAQRDLRAYVETETERQRAIAAFLAATTAKLTALDELPTPETSNV